MMFCFDIVLRTGHLIDCGGEPKWHRFDMDPDLCICRQQEV